MLAFRFFPEDFQGQAPDLRSAYLVGVDGVAVRGPCRTERDLILCETRSPEPLALSLLFYVEDFGIVQIETTRLQPRDEPYGLALELARSRLMRISLKREEWGLFDYPGMEKTADKVAQARDLFVKAMQLPEKPSVAARLARESLAISMPAGEEVCRFHAAVFLARRQQAGMGKDFLGGVLPAAFKEPRETKLTSALAFARVPMIWRAIQPSEQAPNYETLDARIATLAKAGFAIHAGPLLNFGVQFLPDWMYLWENDYEAIFNFARDHIRRTASRYAGRITHWTAAAGLHADGVFPLDLEQIMELTRMAAATLRQAVPRGSILVELTQPWGEYHARNTQTLPPLVYAEMLVQSGIPFDGFGLQVIFGLDSDGYRVRDLLQVASLIDRLANLGKPVSLTAIAAPSATAAAAGGGIWHAPWSEKVQAEWLVALIELGLSRPYVDNVCLQSVYDGPNSLLGSGGILREDGAPKVAYEKLGRLRQRLCGSKRSEALK